MGKAEMTICLRHEVWLASPPRDHPTIVREFRASSEAVVYALYAEQYEADPTLRRVIDHGEVVVGGRVARCTVIWWYQSDAQAGANANAARVGAKPLEKAGPPSSSVKGKTQLTVAQVAYNARLKAIEEAAIAEVSSSEQAQESNEVEAEGEST